MRVVAPNFEPHVMAYVAHLEKCKASRQAWPEHDAYVLSILGQEVMREMPGAAKLPQPFRYLENLVLGDARRRGHTHQWEYDRYSLAALIEKAGFSRVDEVKFDVSSVKDWNEIGLDLTESGGEYKPGSLYMEAVR